MAKIISVHSFRGGTGKSNTTANVVAQMALKGLRVGVVDTDIQSPGIHVLFGMGDDDATFTLNDYLWGNCEITQAAIDLTSRLKIDLPGKVFLIPSSMKGNDIARVLKDRYDVGLLNDGFQKLIKDLKLDVLAIDTHPGLNEETLLSVAISDVLVIVMRPDAQDYQGTIVTVDVARKLEVPRMVLVVNKVPPEFDMAGVKTKVEQTYQCQVAAVVPHSNQLMALASAGIFSLSSPSDPLSAIYTKLAGELVG